MNLDRTAPVPRRQPTSTVPTHVNDVLQAVHEEGDTAEAEADAEAQRPGTRSGRHVSSCSERTDALSALGPEDVLGGGSALVLHAGDGALATGGAVHRSGSHPDGGERGGSLELWLLMLGHHASRGLVHLVAIHLLALRHDALVVLHVHVLLVSRVTFRLASRRSHLIDVRLLRGLDRAVLLLVWRG